jgi:molybdopterin/thiamine biosynthesis adenylyltransferase
MAHLFQVGVGSGGMAALDLICRDERITRVTIVDRDVFEPHNVSRHLFPRRAIGRRKADVASEWLCERRPTLPVDVLPCDVMDPGVQAALGTILKTATLGVCAADNERAKFHFDALMRRHGIPWTLGEVLSGGVGGFVHVFTPGGPCYGCVASFLQRAPVDFAPSPDYSAPGAGRWETTVPAGIASIHAIASLHALITLGLLDGPPPFTSLLMPLTSLPGVFDEPFRSRRFRIERDPECLTCACPPTDEDLDVALHNALGRLG